MKLVREVNEGLPLGYSIKVYAEYMYDNWHGRYEIKTKAELIFNNDVVDKIIDYVLEPKPTRRFIFFVRPPSETWEQRCERSIDIDVSALINHAYEVERRKTVTNGLFSSLAGCPNEYVY